MLEALEDLVSRRRAAGRGDDDERQEVLVARVCLGPAWVFARGGQRIGAGSTDLARDDRRDPRIELAGEGLWNGDVGAAEEARSKHVLVVGLVPEGRERGQRSSCAEIITRPRGRSSETALASPARKRCVASLSFVVKNAAPWLTNRVGIRRGVEASADVGPALVALLGASEPPGTRSMLSKRRPRVKARRARRGAPERHHHRS